uniref:Putative 40s ribosomal protein s10b n=1 Tax=Tabanus bromius TaxID=304241 RepID=A0A0K8TP54_TABBR
MFMPKKHRDTIYKYLFREGVIVAKKDFHLPKHPDLEEDIPNLHVIKTLQSLHSRGLVAEQFAWRHYYWYLTNDGIEYLRSYLHLQPENVPATLKRAARSETGRPRPTAAPRTDGTKTGEDRSAYRRAPGGGAGGDKKADVGPGAGGVEFRGGFGRGQRPQ